VLAEIHHPPKGEVTINPFLYQRKVRMDFLQFLKSPLPPLYKRGEH